MGVDHESGQVALRRQMVRTADPTSAGGACGRELGCVAVNAKRGTRSPDRLARREQEIAEWWRELEGVLG